LFREDRQKRFQLKIDRLLTGYWIDKCELMISGDLANQIDRARSLSAILRSNPASVLFITSPILSWDSFPMISLAESVDLLPEAC